MKKLVPVLFVLLFVGMLALGVPGQSRGAAGGHRSGPGPHAGPGGLPSVPLLIPNVTDTQIQQINGLMEQLRATVETFHQQLGEKESRLRELSVAETADLAQIDTLITEIGALQVEIRKAEAHTHQDVRKVFTDAQRAVFDSTHARPPRPEPPPR